MVTLIVTGFVSMSPNIELVDMSFDQRHELRVRFMNEFNSFLSKKKANTQLLLKAADLRSTDEGKAVLAEYHHVNYELALLEVKIDNMIKQLHSGQCLQFKPSVPRF